MEITIEPWKKLVIHEVIEYRFEDWLKQIAFGSRSVGGGIPTMNWANGIVFQPFHFPDTDAIIHEKLNGVLHWSSVIFAIKEKFEKQIVKDDGTINFIDISVNDIFGKVAEYLKAQSKFIKSS